MISHFLPPNAFPPPLVDVPDPKQVSKYKNSKINRILFRNKYVGRDCPYLVLSTPNKVNLTAWFNAISNNHNVGNLLSYVVVWYLCQFYGIDYYKSVSKTKHLYAVGSILMGYQDVTIWGSGFGYNRSKSFPAKIDNFLHRHYHHVEISAVRGSETRRILSEMGFEAPEIYGDPAILLPLFYNKNLPKTKDYLIIPHYTKYKQYKEDPHSICCFQRDWTYFIHAILSAELVISSSLHGIILAEAYGVPAILLKDTPSEDITKYKDWYYSTERYEFPIANSITDALQITPSIPSKEVLLNLQKAC